LAIGLLTRTRHDLLEDRAGVAAMACIAVVLDIRNPTAVI
jgi:hypothetical protein